MANHAAPTLANMAKTKALRESTNRRLRSVVRSVVQSEFGGVAERAAESFGVSGSFVSDFLSGKKGAGPALLLGIAPYDPLEFLRAVGIEPKTLLMLWRDQSGEGGELPTLPEPLKRAARAAVELLHCSIDEAGQAAIEALAELGEGSEDRTPLWWLEELRPRLPKRRASGVRKRTESGGNLG